MPEYDKELVSWLKLKQSFFSSEIKINYTIITESLLLLILKSQLEPQLCYMLLKRGSALEEIYIHKCDDRLLHKQHTESKNINAEEVVYCIIRKSIC